MQKQGAAYSGQTVTTSVNDKLYRFMIYTTVIRHSRRLFVLLNTINFFNVIDARPIFSLYFPQTVKWTVQFLSFYFILTVQSLHCSRNLNMPCEIKS